MSKKPVSKTPDQFTKEANDFKLGFRIDLVEVLLKDFQLQHYWNALSEPISRKFHSQFFTEEWVKSYLMNVYEGVLYSHLTREQTRMVLVAAMYSRVGFDHNQPIEVSMFKAMHMFDHMHGYLTENKATAKFALSDEDRKEINRLIRHTFKEAPWSPNTNIKEAILRDASLMWRYHNEPEVLKRFLVGFDMESTEPLNTETQFKRHSAACVNFRWSTRWAKMKNVVLNFPAKDQQNAIIAI